MLASTVISLSIGEGGLEFTQEIKSLRDMPEYRATLDNWLVCLTLMQAIMDSLLILDQFSWFN